MNAATVNPTSHGTTDPPQRFFARIRASHASHTGRSSQTRASSSFPMRAEQFDHFGHGVSHPSFATAISHYWRCLNEIG